jgi:DNA-binding NtrC family response regulator
MKAILFVDDHEVLARLSCQIIQMQGYSADYAYNAGDAIAKFKHGNYQMLVTDLRMEDMDGLQLAKEIRQQSPGLPVVVVTGLTPVEQEGDEKYSWLEKQYLFPALLDKIKEMIGEPDEAATPLKALQSA